MEGWWLVSYVVNWVLLLALGIFCVAILRQMGLLYVRLGGSLGALQTPEGPHGEDAGLGYYRNPPVAAARDGSQPLQVGGCGVACILDREHPLMAEDVL